MKQLSKDEMKNVIGGVMDFPYTCTCYGCVGQWIYPNGQPSDAQERQDVCDIAHQEKLFVVIIHRLCNNSPFN